MGAILGLMTPARRWISDERLYAILSQVVAHPANDDDSGDTKALGKPVGVLVFSWLAVRSQIAIRPPDLGWRLVAGGGLLAGVGFTMALFIANLAFSKSLIDSAKPGIFLASVFSAVAGFALLKAVSRNAKQAHMARH